MANLEQLHNEVESILKNVALKNNITNYEPIFNIKEALRGDGFLGEFFLAGIKNQNTNEEIRVAIKKAVKDPSKRAEFLIPWIYSNEMYFYSTIVPAFSKLQVQKSLREPFVEVAKFYYGTLVEFQEALVLEDLKVQGYDIREKRELFDDEHTRLILKTYGKLHALSFALKDQNIDEYRKLVSGIKLEFMATVTQNKSFKLLLQSVVNDTYAALNEQKYEIVQKKFEKYKNHPSEHFQKALHLESDHKIIVHADCWSNNMMFKYSDSGKLESMKLIDFQIMTEANPVRDLSHFIYSGHSKEQLDKFEDYLKVYYASLSTNLRELGSDPEKLYPFGQLFTDWSKHALFGLFFSLMVAKVKLIENNDMHDIVKDDTDADMMSGMLNAKVNIDLYNERTRNIVLHAEKYNAI